MKRIYLILSAFLFTLTAFSQKQMSIEDAVLGRYSYLYPRQLSRLQWLSDDKLIYVANDTIWETGVKKNDKKLLISGTALKDAASKKEIDFARIPAFTTQNANELVFNSGNTISVFNLKNSQFECALEIPEGAEVPDFSAEGQSVAYVKGQNLFILKGGKEMQVTNETQEGIVCGRYVHRREFGIEKGTFWSPSGKYLAFYRKDESMVKDYPLVDFMTCEAEETPVKYPMAGMTSHQVTLGIYNTETGETTYLKSGGPDDHYLTNISWGPNEEFIYMAELNREQNHMQLNQYRVAGGEKVKTILEESRSTYVEPQHPILFSKTNDNQFYYWTRNDGWFHVYLYNTDGKLIKQLTKGDWEVTEFYGTDAKENYAYIQATKESPLDRHIYRVNIKNGAIEKLDSEAGTHDADFSPSFTYFTDKWSADENPGQTDLLTSSGKLVYNISKAENTLADYQLGENKIVKLTAADGTTDLYARMILPTNFNPNKKYPTIVYVYGGPHVQLVRNTWHNAADWWFYYMASQGYILFTVDSRGSANRGQAFEEVIHRQLGIEETKDQMKGIEYLKSLPYVDQNRIGVHGWSFGGFMTLNLMTRQPETFKVGVAGGPVVDWDMYEVMYGERYMDTPQENPEGYNESNMLNHVADLQGKLMLIHGVQDETVVMQHSMKFLRECIEQDKQVDFFAYPTHEHNVRGKDRVHLMQKISQYFFDYLKESPQKQNISQAF
ncbi:S9 family peptidase [Mangrovibacterium diazotrophicum]|uniref:Dipeptidyl-peptidase-4 n=1 Tax=Mangrovibacterium diazotrophicum TaxID=1261403 RepID=A0A419W2L7_9BACT|nr:S9 family peptidase [Mangrovibacterium diazotrophicum]RKD89722.1 dipeptidyl-peptidase-4 [Mangrovibacterium diazotrophicum]